MRAVAALAAGLAVMAAGAAQAGRAAYPGKNGLIAFTRVTGDIWTIRPDGTGLKRLTKTPKVLEKNPAWSPDGTKLAYDDGAGSIWVMDASGKNPVNLSAVEADPDAGTCDYQPTWSPDGKQIAFSAITNECTGAAGEIDVMNADGTGRRVLEDEYSGLLGGDDEPAWGPGGGRIAITRSDSERMASGPYDSDVWVLDAKTGRPLRALTANANSGAPAWRPNGKQVAFGGPKGVTVVGANGKSATFLAQGGDPAWSPDSGQIVYDNGDLYVVRTNGSKARRLLLRCGVAHCERPDWQPLPR